MWFCGALERGKCDQTDGRKAVERERERERDGGFTQ